MGTPLVEEAEIDLKPFLQISNAVVGVEVGMLVVHRAPEPFDEDVVHPAGLPINTSLVEGVATTG